MSGVKVNIVRNDTHAVVTVTNTEPEQAIGEGETGTKSILDVSFCQDVSGSMGCCGELQGAAATTRLDLCKTTLKFVLRYLKGHRVGLTSFDFETATVIPSETVADDTSGLEQRISSMRPGSSTNLSAGLQRSLLDLTASSADGLEGRVKYLMVFTDGIANAGLTTEPQLLALLREHISQIQGNVRVALFAFGSGCNHDLLQNLAAGVDGTYYSLESAEDIPSAIGEVFGTALETRQQNLDLGYPADLMETMPGEKPSFPDLLRGESRSRLFRMMDPASFAEGKFTLRYLDCATSKTVTVPVTCDQAVTNPVTVSEAVNVNDVAETTRQAADIWGERRREMLQSCLDRLLQSPSASSEKTQLLAKTLRQQLERGDLCPPSLMRQCSSNTRNFRGLGYASKGVADFAAESQRQVSASLRVTDLESVSSTTSAEGLYPGASQVAPLPRPNLRFTRAEESV